LNCNKNTFTARKDLSFNIVSNWLLYFVKQKQFSMSIRTTQRICCVDDQIFNILFFHNDSRTKTFNIQYSILGVVKVGRKII